MKIELNHIKVRDLVDGYTDDGESVVGYSGKLDIRPRYQRNFVYKDEQREAVIRTIRQEFPLNVMYWAVRDDGTYEVIDGQQRTISIAQYVEGDFSINDMGFHNLTDKEQDQILDYELFIYFCEGTDREKLDWFKIVNIAGEKLSDQELRNAVYSGSWVSDAKRYFSRSNCAAYGIARDYLAGKMNRQGYLETAIKWASKGDITGYMSKHQHDSDATELWEYFKGVINWIETTFPNKRKDLMKGQDWGTLYADFKDAELDPYELEEEIKELIDDYDVTSQRGIYPYVLTRDERKLEIRAFDKTIKRRKYEEQDGVCAGCGESFTMEEMEADHIDPWVEGGKTEIENCQMLCKPCNRRKSSK